MSVKEPSERMHFGDQAHVFEKRAGLSKDVTQQIATAIQTLASIPGHGVVVDIGAGTGEIGQWLASHNHSYIGIDSSGEMLAEFKAKLLKRDNANLVLSDADQDWPIASGSAHVVFGSRVFHLLDIPHLLAEVKRVAAPEGAYLISGRVMRAQDSIKGAMRKKMRNLLLEKGFQPRPTEERRKQVFLEAKKQGAQIHEPIVAAEWEVATKPMDSIEGWRLKESMGGINPPAEVRMQVLEKLMEWTTKTWGDPHALFASTERYVLESARFN